MHMPRPHGWNRSRKLLLGVVAIVILFPFFVRLRHLQVGPEEDEVDYGWWPETKNKTFLFLGDVVDVPRALCSGLTHQRSSLRCALEYAWILKRTFVIPHTICLQARHNVKTGLRLPNEGKHVITSLESLFDTSAINASLRGHLVFSDDPSWKAIQSNSHILQVDSSVDIKRLQSSPKYTTATVLHLNAGDFWLTLCQKRKISKKKQLPAPRFAAKLEDAAKRIAARLGDFDLLHVRRGDKVKLDSHGKTIYPHLNSDTKSKVILRKLLKWIPVNRTIYLCTDETKKGYFAVLKKKYNLKTAMDFADIFKEVATNNYEVFAIEKSLVRYSKTHMGTFPGESHHNLNLCVDPREGVKYAKRPVYRVV